MAGAMSLRKSFDPDREGVAPLFCASRDWPCSTTCIGQAEEMNSPPAEQVTTKIANPRPSKPI
jgi:hypothetical protein